MTSGILTSRIAKYSLLPALYLACCQTLFAAGHAHVHGHGTLLIAQEGDNWQLEFNLPAADIVGFEHAAQNQQDKMHLLALSEKLEDPVNVFTTSGGSCRIVEQDIDLPGNAHHERHDEEDSHEHVSDKKHADVTLRYQLQCKSKLRAITITLFDLSPSLNEIDAQWIVDAGQGQTELGSAKRKLVW